jgi:arylsulfatase A-like enzyme
VRFGLWLGLVYGLIEALEVQILRLIPGILSWRTGNSSNVMWVAPVTYGAAFAIVALVLWAMTRPLRARVADVVLAFVALALGAFFALTLPGLVFVDLAGSLLAVGVATELTRQYVRHRAAVQAFVQRSLPWLVSGVLALGIVIVVGSSAMERWRMRTVRAATDGKPNVLILVIDTQRADHLSSYGYARPTSPRLDAFAREATVFEAAYSNSSWTLPSHASLFTGALPDEHRAGVMRRPYLDSRFPTIAEVMRDNGYATGGFVSNTYWCGRQTGLHRGFIRYEDFYGNLGDAVARTAMGRRLAYDVMPRFGIDDIPGRKRAAEINADLLGWIDDMRGRPFFAFANYFDVHGPYAPPPPYAGRFTASGTAKEKTGKIELGALTGAIVVPPKPELEAMVAAYDESILYLDDQLGKLFDGLRQRGLLENTIVVVTSDHGESWGEHGLMYHGHSLYRDQLHVPLMVRYPKAFTPGSRDPRAVGLDRLPATIASLTGTPASFPGHALTAYPADSLASRLQRAALDTSDGEGTESSPPAVVAEVARRSSVPAGWPTSKGSLAALLTERWHLIVPEAGAGDAELYDMQADPDETRNLFADSSHVRIAKSLRAQLDRQRRANSVTASPR